MDSLEDLKKPDAIFFDWDGTLVDTLPGLLKAHNHVRQHFGFVPWTEAEFHGHMKQSSRELYPSIYGDRVEEAFTQLRLFMHENLISLLKPLENAETLLSTLKKQSIPVGIVSNKRHEFLIKEVEHLGWGQYIDVQAGAGYAEKDKPSGVPIRKALSSININPEQNHVWFVGDTETDLLAAQDADCMAILLVHGQDRSDLIKKHNPAHVSQDCATFLALINNIL